MSAEFMSIYHCNQCGLTVEVLDPGMVPSCCGQEMTLMALKSQDTGVEKHLPVVEANGDGIKVKVGSVPHPMEEKHYIEWIEVMDGNKIVRKHLKPGVAPEADFCLKLTPSVKVRIYCNIHGLWGKA